MAFQNFLGYYKVFQNFLRVYSVFVVLIIVYLFQGFQFFYGVLEVSWVCIWFAILDLLWFTKVFQMLRVDNSVRSLSYIPFSAHTLPDSRPHFLYTPGPAASERAFYIIKGSAVFRCFQCNNTFAKYCNTGLFKFSMLLAFSGILGQGFSGFQGFSAVFFDFLAVSNVFSNSFQRFPRFYMVFKGFLGRPMTFQPFLMCFQIRTICT